MILGKERDPRLVTVRRGGTLRDADHRRLAAWAADCARHVLHLFEHERPDAAQAVAVSHVPAHELGAAAYAIRAARAAAPEGERAGSLECRWQRARLAGEIRELVLDEQGLRDGACWHVFDR